MEVDPTEQTCKNYPLADGFLPCGHLLLSGPSLLKGWKSLWFLETGIILSQKVTGSFFTKNWGNANQLLLHGYSATNKRTHREHPV